MPKGRDAHSDPELSDLRDQLADALAELERLQAQAADAEAKGATLQERQAEAQNQLAQVRAELEQRNADFAQREQELAEARRELATAREEAESLRGWLGEAVLKYRDARLAVTPNVPPDLVSGETIEEIDQQFEAARKLVSEVRDRLQSESQASRVPIGSPPRRAPDLSALSPGEKIRLGLSRQ